MADIQYVESIVKSVPEQAIKTGQSLKSMRRDEKGKMHLTFVDVDGVERSDQVYDHIIFAWVTRLFYPPCIATLW